MYELDFSGSSAMENPPAKAWDESSTPCRWDPLEQEMATGSSILSLEIQWTEEPGRLTKATRFSFMSQSVSFPNALSYEF